MATMADAAITPVLPPPAASPPTPCTDHTSLPQELWLEIFRCATYVPRTRGISASDPFQRQRPANFASGVNTPVSALRTKSTLVLVCRAWRALATELLYEHVVLSSRRNASLFVRALAAPAGHARWLRHLEVHTYARTARTAAFWRAVAQALSLASNLQAFSGFWEHPVPAPVLAFFARAVGPSLHALYWEESTAPDGAAPALLAPALLATFRALRVLDLRTLKLAAEHDIPAAAAARAALPAVRDLLLPTTPALLRFAARALALPRLRRLTLRAAPAHTHSARSVRAALAALLAAHGAPLTAVELQPAAADAAYRPGPVPVATFLQPGVCPALDTLVFDCREKTLGPPHADAARRKDGDGSDDEGDEGDDEGGGGGETGPAPAAPHGALRRVGVRGLGISRLYPNRPTLAQAHLRALLGAAARGALPALEVVRTLGCLVDASTDACAPDVFIWWTEKFEAAGVDLQDGEGVVWLYTDPVPDPPAFVDFVDMSVPVTYVHKSDGEQYSLVKAQT